MQMQRSWRRDIAYRDLVQVVLRDPAEEILTHILHRRFSYTDLAQVLLQVLGRSWHRHFAEVVLRDSDAEILRQTWHPLLKSVFVAKGWLSTPPFPGLQFSRLRWSCVLLPSLVCLCFGLWFLSPCHLQILFQHYALASGMHCAPFIFPNDEVCMPFPTLQCFLLWSLLLAFSFMFLQNIYYIFLLALFVFHPTSFVILSQSTMWCI